jgi:alpha-1,3-rhamnosyl/mannosyltransferase
LPALRRVAPELRQLLICSPGNRHLFDQGEEVIEMSLGRGGSARRIWCDQVTVPRVIEGRADVLFTPAGVGTLRTSLPQVILVAAHLALPSCQRLAGDDGLSRWHRIYYGTPFRWSLRSADAVLAISQFVADGLVTELGVDPGKVGAMPLGVEPPRQSPIVGRREPVVLFVGTLYGYKDAMIALRSFATARPSLPDGARLLIVGKDPDGQQVPMLREAAAWAGIAEDIDVLGAVDDAELDAVYRQASVLLMPSRCEGFGLPVAEAMSYGVPVVVADSTSLPEVAAGAGVLVAIGDIDGFARAIVEVLTDREHHRDLAQRGLARARELTWDSAAERLGNAFRAVMP